MLASVWRTASEGGQSSGHGQSGKPSLPYSTNSLWLHALSLGVNATMRVESKWWYGPILLLDKWRPVSSNAKISPWDAAQGPRGLDHQALLPPPTFYAPCLHGEAPCPPPEGLLSVPSDGRVAEHDPESQFPGRLAAGRSVPLHTQNLHLVEKGQVTREKQRGPLLRAGQPCT